MPAVSGPCVLVGSSIPKRWQKEVLAVLVCDCCSAILGGNGGIRLQNGKTAAGVEFGRYFAGEQGWRKGATISSQEWPMWGGSDAGNPGTSILIYNCALLFAVFHGYMLSLANTAKQPQARTFRIAHTIYGCTALTASSRHIQSRPPSKTLTDNNPHPRAVTTSPPWISHP